MGSVPSGRFRTIQRVALGLSLIVLLVGSIATAVEAAAVKTSLTIQSSPNPAQTTDSVVVSGVLAAGSRLLPSQNVQVQFSTDSKKWKTIAIVGAGPDGKYTLTWTSSTQGKFYLKAVFSGTKQYDSSVSKIIIQQMVQPSPPNPPPPTASVFGGVHSQLTAELVTLVKSAGIRWVRYDVTFDTKFQTTYSLATSNSINLIGILDFETVAWNPSFTLADWTTAVSNAQATYPSIRVWEIWNEPTQAQFKLGYMDGTPQHYLDLLSSAYQILKSKDPGSTILGLGGSQLGLGDYGFANTVFSLGGGAFMDAISIHAYPYDLNAGKTWDYYKQLWTQEISLYKQFGKPIWVTETGLRSAQSSESDQATYLSNSYQFFKGQGVSAFIWYRLHDYVSSNGDTVSWGILRSDFSTKQSYSVYSSFLTQ